ncbi:MAG TPA: exodeoxyribonuclease VII small subunit [Candidatus Omnitrophica bacterium]|nr:exodeoxyribonuclease VII small subunit [Candidatus Omnitrophota bacterium]
MTFEETLERLEKIVGELEEGKLPLEQSLHKYEEGIKMIRLLRKKLQEVEKRIEIVKREEDGTLKKEKFQIPEDKQ